MSDKIQKFIDSLGEDFRGLLKARLAQLREDPYKIKDVIKMKGGPNLYRLRIGKVRIIYTITKDKKVEVIDIDYRGNIY